MTMMTSQLGPRAALILGILQGGPRTDREVAELVALAARGENLTFRMAGRELEFAGAARATLERLEDFGMVVRVDDPDGVTLWARAA